MRNELSRVIAVLGVFFFVGEGPLLWSQCPVFTSSSITGNTSILCEGESVTLSIAAENVAPGSFIDWYIGPDATFDPYNGEGVIIGSVPVMADPCGDAPEILYIMVNPDNAQVGSSGDQCDEFMVLWTGSGGFTTSDILVSNLGPGTFQWDGFVAGNGTTFSCGIPLPPGPVPANAILIIQSHTVNNVPIDSDVLCASGLPVYIISYNGTTNCTGGYFDNNSPCSSCPVMIDINGAGCQYEVDLDYQPPSSSVDGWAWANTGSGVFADVIPPLDIPMPGTVAVTIPDFTWTIPADFCETMGGGAYFITGIPDPPPGPGCIEITTPFYGLDISCPEMILSGGGDVCEGSCPDNPTPISFEIIGGDVPFTADIIVSVTGFPNFPIDNLEIVNGQSILVCLQGFFPSFDPGTGILNVPVLAIGQSATVQITSLTSNAGCPVSVNPNSITLNFIEAATSNAGPDQVICQGESVTLFGSIGGSATEAMWTTDGDGDFNDPTDLNAIYTPGPGDIANGNVTLTLTGLDANGACLPAESTMTITIEESIFIEVNTPLTVCNTDVANVVALFTGIMTPSTWMTSGDGFFDDPSIPVTFYTPGPGDISAGTVTLTFEPDDPDVCIGNIEPLILTIVQAPDVNVPFNLEICDDESAEIQISIQGDYTTITWMTAGDGDLVVINDLEVTYTPGPSDISNEFVIVSVTVQSIYPECGQTTYNIPIIINDCLCPPLELVAMHNIAPCFYSDTVDLNVFLVEGGPGQWSIGDSPSGSNPAVIENNLFITNNSDWGWYTLYFVIDNPVPGCPDSASIATVVQPFLTPHLGVDLQACSGEAVDLNASYEINPHPNSEWESLGDGVFLNPDPVQATYLPGPMDAGQNVIIVLHVPDYGCGELTDTLVIVYVNPPSAVFQADTLMICNDSGSGSIFDFVAAISSGDNTGNWTNPSGVPVNLSNPAAVDFNGIAEGYYNFQYQTASAIPPCMDSVYTLVIQVTECDCPVLVVQNLPGGVCSDLPLLALNAFIMAGEPGSWQIISSPSGGNPATLAGDNLIINGADPGEYQLRFTFDSAPIPGCPDSAEISIFIQEPPAINLIQDLVLCSNQIIELIADLSGSADSISWSTSGTGTFSNFTDTSIIFSPSLGDVANGQVYVIGTTTDTLGYCPAGVDTMDISILMQVFATFSQTTTTICNNPDSGAVVNLSLFLTGGDLNGIWTDVSGSGAVFINSSTVDFSGLTEGDYSFQYSTISASPPCLDEVYSFTVTVRDCICPALELITAPIELCRPDGFDLQNIMIDTDPGTWTITDGPAFGSWPVIAGNALTTLGAFAGNYTLTYTLQNVVPGCPAAVSISMTLETAPFISVMQKSCDDDTLYYEVVIQSDANTLLSDFGNVTLTGPGQFKVDSIPVNQGIIVEATSLLGLCTTNLAIAPADCDCTLFTEDIADTIAFCPGDTVVLIPFITGAHGLPFSTWITPKGTFMKPSLPLYEEGQYVWVVVDSLNCERRDTFLAVFIGPESAVLSSTPPSCPGTTDGQITIESIEGGTPPYSVQLDGGPSMLIPSLPFVLNNAGLGIHVLTISDAIGCEIQSSIVVDDPTFGDIDLGPDVTVTKGDSVYIIPEVTNIAIMLSAWNHSFLPPGIQPFWFTPDSTLTLQLMITDSAGCIYIDDKTITLVEKAVFYIPNIFSPNSDQVNDIWEVISSLPQDRLQSLQIFDRWGSLLYQQDGNPPFRWEGTSGDQVVNPGVFVYRLFYTDEYGDTQVKFGDITIIK